MTASDPLGGVAPYPEIDAADPAAFHAAFRALAAVGGIDSVGGSEWQGTLADAICRHLGIDPTIATVFWLRDIIEYVGRIAVADDRGEEPA